MDALPEGRDIRFTFENVEATCPHCEYRNTFNRRSDLRTLGPIDSLRVACESPSCSKAFHIMGDLVNPAYEMIIFYCQELLGQRLYSYCVLNLVQAFEAFFYQALRVDLLYKPLWANVESGNDVSALAALEGLLDRRTRRFSFQDLRDLFISHVLYDPLPKSLAESEIVVMRVPAKPARHSNDEIRKTRTIANEKVRELLLRLNACKVHELRNRVVHSRMYRPSVGEALQAYNDARAILLPLGPLLNVRDADPNRYSKQQTRLGASLGRTT